MKEEHISEKIIFLFFITNFYCLHVKVISGYRLMAVISEGDGALEQATPGGWISGDIQDPPGRGPVQPAVGDPASAGGLD